MNIDGKVVAGIIAFMVLLAAFAIWYEWRYPCLRSETYSCTITRCAAYNSDGICIHHITEPSTCTRCIQRGDREALPTEIP